MQTRCDHGQCNVDKVIMQYGMKTRYDNRECNEDKKQDVIIKNEMKTSYDH